MKIKTKKLPYSKVLEISKPKHKYPKKPNILFRTIIRIAALPDLWATRFKYTTVRMDKAGKGPFLILMNHSSFIDLEIASRIFYPMPYGIVCTSDGFVGKEWLMRCIGCMPTQKFVTDVTLVKDLIYTINKKKMSVLMYPEASYTFDGTATPLPRRLGVLIKKLGVPVLTVITDGAFLRDPLYNGLQKRKTKVSAKLNCLFTKEDVEKLSVEELDRQLDEEFSFDNFANQYDKKIKITEPFRADGLNRILYRCAACNTEGQMEGKGTYLTCKHCGKTYFMDEYGRLNATSGETEFSHIPDWYNWQRECVKKEIIEGDYKLETQVDIAVLRDFKAIYKVGSGQLIHTTNGFTLTGCDGELNYHHSPLASYGLYSDYFWYEIGDVICIGNKEMLYYCFPKDKSDIVAKTRIAAEEIYKLKKEK